MTLREGSLFTGTTALGMAATAVLGSEPAWFADIDPGAAALLAHHYPHTPDGWITNVPGLTRNQQLKLAGNGVVVQQGIAAASYLFGLLGVQLTAAA